MGTLWGVRHVRLGQTLPRRGGSVGTSFKRVEVALFAITLGAFLIQEETAKTIGTDVIMILGGF